MMRITGVRKCAYCGLDFTASYENWLTMALDHVVLMSVCKSLGIPEGWCEDSANMVLACAACNTFCNHYKPEGVLPSPRTVAEFFDLRDLIFSKRKEGIAERHKQDREFFAGRPWER
jgi:hypothetical protein